MILANTGSGWLWAILQLRTHSGSSDTSPLCHAYTSLASSGGYRTRRASPAASGRNSAATAVARPWLDRQACKLVASCCSVSEKCMLAVARWPTLEHPSPSSRMNCYPKNDEFVIPSYLFDLILTTKTKTFSTQAGRHHPTLPLRENDPHPPP